MQKGAIHTSSAGRDLAQLLEELFGVRTGPPGCLGLVWGAVFGVAQGEIGMLQRPSTAPVQAAGSRGCAGLGGGPV